MKYYVEWGGKTRVVEVRASDAGLTVTVDGDPHPADLATVDGSGLMNLLVDGRSVSYGVRFEEDACVLSFHDRDVRVPIMDERTRLARLATGGAGGKAAGAEVKSVMPGVVKEMRVAEGDQVAEGQPLLILEAMKMENEIRAPAAGRVAKVAVEAGAAVEKGALLIRLAPEEESAATPSPAPAV